MDCAVWASSSFRSFFQRRKGIQVPSPFSGEKVFRFPLPSEERRCSGYLSFQRREGVQAPSPFRGEKVFRFPLPSEEIRCSDTLSPKGGG